MERILVRSISIGKPTTCRCTIFWAYWISLYMFWMVFPSIIRSPKLYIQLQVYVTPPAHCWTSFFRYMSHHQLTAELVFSLRPHASVYVTNTPVLCAQGRPTWLHSTACICNYSDFPSLNKSNWRHHLLVSNMHAKMLPKISWIGHGPQLCGMCSAYIWQWNDFKSTILQHFRLSHR